MTRDEVMNALTELGTIEDAAERRSRITSISEEVTSIYDNNENLTSSNAKLTEDKKKLQEYNMELYLKVGAQKQKEETKPQSEDLKYDDLFNEKGEIK